MQENTRIGFCLAVAGLVSSVVDAQVTQPSWVLKTAIGQPSQRDRFDMAFDAARRQVVLHGGSWMAGIVLGGTFVWDGVAWSAAGGAGGPGARRDHGMVYDAARARVVLFGGEDGNGAILGDTWEWDGSAWTVRQSTGSPPRRSRHAMGYDPARQRVVLFGGSDASGSLLDDTWEWDGTSWTRRAPAVRPPPRRAHRLVAGASPGRLLLFGGFDTIGRGLADSWAWDGVGWSAIAGPAPAARGEHAMAYDRDRGVVVLFGGRDRDGGGLLGDTWEWDGRSWQLRSFGTAPTARAGAGAAYDETRQRLVLYGGLDGTTLWQRDAWVYGNTVPASVQTIGAGCGRGVSTPLLSASGVPALGSSSFSLAIAGAPSLHAVAFLLSAGAGPRPLDDRCVWWLDPHRLLDATWRTTSLGGSQRQTVPIPLDPSLTGMRLHAQAVVFDPLRVRLVAMTQGLVLVIGD